MLKSVYTFPRDTDFLCKNNPCLMPELHSLWFPADDHIDMCNHLMPTTVSWTPTPTGITGFISFSFHAIPHEESYKMALCDLPGMLLKSGEWISEFEMPEHAKALSEDSSHVDLNPP